MYECTRNDIDGKWVADDIEDFLELKLVMTG